MKAAGIVAMFTNEVSFKSRGKKLAMSLTITCRSNRPEGNLPSVVAKKSLTVQ